MMKSDFLTERRPDSECHILKDLANQFLINSSSLLFLSSVMHKSCVDYNKIHKKMVSAEYKRGSFWIQIGKNMQISWIHFFLCLECVNYNNGYLILDLGSWLKITKAKNLDNKKWNTEYTHAPAERIRSWVATTVGVTNLENRASPCNTITIIYVSKTNFCISIIKISRMYVCLSVCHLMSMKLCMQSH